MVAAVAMMPGYTCMPNNDDKSINVIIALLYLPHH
jgi:hypothetical protein